MEELNSRKDVFSHQWDEDWGVREHFSASGLNLGSAGRNGKGRAGQVPVADEAVGAASYSDNIPVSTNP